MDYFQNQVIPKLLNKTITKMLPVIHRALLSSSDFRQYRLYPIMGKIYYIFLEKTTIFVVVLLLKQDVGPHSVLSTLSHAHTPGR